MNGIFIIPTGIGCAIGGHAGDAVCAANLIASQCGHLIINPNAVNASDINEMAPNCLYVEGSTINRFLTGGIQLRISRRNDILLAVNRPVVPQTVNSANAARVALGTRIEIVELDAPLVLTAEFEADGSAGGSVKGAAELVAQVKDHSFDALAIQTPIDVPDAVVERYLRSGGVNPWGGVEAKASRAIADSMLKPVAHAPVEPEDSYFRNFNEVVDPRQAAEVVSVSYLHCVLKGLARAPIPCVDGGLRASEFDFLVTPDSCFGAPHEICLDRGIEVIVVRDNPSVLSSPFPDSCTFVANYLECAGLLACRRAGILEQHVLAGDLN